ncbi:MAG: serine acetyltransferase [Muribaculaceae bacterium]|nr:serine acetyltransferase [Muribaculaceae bacterium]
MRLDCLQDLYRYEGTNAKSFLVKLKYLLFVPGFQYSYCFRHAHTSKNIVSRLFWNSLLRLMMYHSGIQIPAATRIGPGLMFGHWGTIVINERTIIGCNFMISHGALIGNTQGRKKGTPIIGDNVKVGANAIILGNVRIGNNVLIAPGAFVNMDVPDNSIVIGNPGKIITKSESPTSVYIHYPYEQMQ